MDEIQMRENLRLIREDIADMTNERLRMVIERIMGVIEFQDERIIELQDRMEDLE